MKISKEILISITAFLLLPVNASAQTYASICMDNPPTGGQSENTCLLKPRHFSEFTYETGYGGNYKSSLSEAMDATVAYFSQGRTNICSVSWTVDSVEPLILDSWIESREMLRGRSKYTIHWSLFDTSKGQCINSEGSGYVYQTRHAYCWDPKNEADKAGWSPFGFTDIQSSGCVYRDTVRNDEIFQICSIESSGTTPKLIGNPVQISTGNKIEVVNDFKNNQSNSINFNRLYNSGWVVNSKTAPPNSFGKGWSHDHEAWLTSSWDNIGYGKTLNEKAYAAGHESIEIGFSTGDKYKFHRMIPGHYNGKSGNLRPGGYTSAADGISLERAIDGWVFRKFDNLYTFNNFGRLVKHAFPNRDVIDYTYSSDGKLIEIKNSKGKKATFSFNGDQVKSIKFTPGLELNYIYSEGLLSSVRFEDNSSIGYIYNNDSLLTGKIDETGQRIGTYEYTDGRITHSKTSDSANKFGFSYSHTPSARITTVTPAIGPSITRKIQKYGRKTIVGGGGNSINSIQVHPLKSISLAPDGYTNFEADYFNSLTYFTWNKSLDAPISIKEAAGTKDERLTEINWMSQGAPNYIKIGSYIKQYEYDNLLNPIKISISESPGIIESYEYIYDSRNNLLSAKDSIGNFEKFSYDVSDNLISYTNPKGHLTSYSQYDALGNFLEIKKPTDQKFNFAYDLRGRITSISSAGFSIHYTYLLNGLVSQASFPNGYTINYQYDSAQRIIGWSDNRGNSQNYTLDDVGNRTYEATKDSSNSVVYEIQRTINDMNRVVKEDSGSSLSWSYGYNANGDLTTITDGLGKVMILTRDGLRRVSSIKNQNNTSTFLTRNLLDSITQAKDFKGVSTNYTRDIFGNAKDETTPDAGNTTSTYDSRGLLTSTTDATGRTIGVDRDALGRITKLNYNDNTSSLLKHDLLGAAYNTPDAPNASIGSLSEVQDPGVTTQYQRDALSRVVRKTQTLTGGETRSTSYTYVPAGQGGAGSLKSITYPSGKTLEYSYDSTGLITGMAWNGAPLVSALKWSPLGVPTEWTWPGIKMSPTDPSALLESRQYNTAGQLIHSGLLDLTWDAAGRVTAIAQSHMIPGSGSDPAQRGMVSSSFNYNATGNLTASAHALMATPAVTLPAGVTLPDLVGYTSLGYSYDANGNRTSGVFTKATGTGTPLTLTRTYATTTGTNRLASVTTSSSAGGTIPAKTYEYDASGSLTNAAGQYLHYGANGRVAKLTNTSSSTDPLVVSYVYNSSSQRVLKTDARTAGTTSSEHAFYSDDDGTSPLGFYSSQRSSNSAAPAGENDSTELLYLPTANGLMPIAAQINGRIYAIDTDHLNTPRRLTNADGQVAWQWLITGFGEVSPTTGAGGYLQPGSTVTAASYAPAVTFNLRYPGQQWDQETGLAYNINRYYDASSGRYIQADPIGLDGGWNRFAYVSGNPLNGIDPLGLYESSPWLRALVPGQVPFDQGMTALENGNYGAAAISFGTMLGEQVLTAASFGLNRAVASVGGGACGLAANEAGSIRNVNVVGGRMNCVNCVVATDATLAGRPASALPGGPYRIGVLERFYGSSFSAPGVIGGVVDSMTAAGAGARGIVFGSRGSEVGHVFNVVNQNGVVRFLDGQTGRAATLDGYRNFQLLRTN